MVAQDVMTAADGPADQAHGVVLIISFGPSSTPVLPRAVALARAHAEDLEHDDGTWGRFHLRRDEATYGWALQLLYMVAGWRGGGAWRWAGPRSSMEGCRQCFTAPRNG